MRSTQVATQPRRCAKLTASRIASSSSRCHESAKRSSPDRIARAAATLRGQVPNTTCDAHELVARFTAQHFPGFIAWIEKRWKDNDKAVIAPNPQNHMHGVDESTIDVAIGRENAEARFKYQQQISPGFVFARGSVQSVLRSLAELSPDQRLEAAMGFLIQYRNNNPIENAPEFRQFEKIQSRQLGTATGSLPEGLENPLYRGVAEAVLQLFKERRWYKAAARPRRED